MLALWLLVGCFPAATDQPPASTEPAAARPDVLFITLDTTRADRLGSYGYAAARTETLDGLAASGRRYAAAYSPLPLTIPSHATMFTGKNPPTHGIRSNGGGVLVEAHRTLAEILQDADYATAASVSAFVTTRQWGFAQGFDAYFDEIPKEEEVEGTPSNFWHEERRADAVIDDALGWLATVGTERPRFVWVHLYDAHFPYRPPEGYLDPADPRPYDGEIAYVDDQVERLVQAFAGRPTYVVVVGDHGEGLGDHGDLTHGLFAYTSTQHVPWLLTGPGIEPGVVSEPVGLSDILPTLLEALDLPVPDGVEGQVRPAGDAAMPVYMESWQLAQRFGVAPHVALVEGRYALLDLPRPELYDVVADPGQLRDLAVADPALAAPIIASLQAKLAALNYAPPGDDGAEVAADVAGQLAALGYVDGGQPLTDRSTLPDPKDRVELLRLVQLAERAESLKDKGEAERIYRRLVKEYGEVIEFKTRLGALLARTGRTQEAVDVVKAGLAIDPESPALLAFLAGQYASQGRFREASIAFETVARAQPFAPRHRALAVSSARHGGDRDRAHLLGAEWRAAYPEDDQLAGAYGVLLGEEGRLAEALPMLEQGIQGDPPEGEVAWMLAVEAIRRGHKARGLELLAMEVKHHPGHFRAAHVMARVAGSLGKWEDQLVGASAAVAARPQLADAHYQKVLALFNLGRYAEARAAVTAGLAVDQAYPDLILMDANLLAKEGRKDLGAQRFELAKAALAAREAAKAGVKTSEAEAMGLVPTDGQTPVAPAALPAWDVSTSLWVPQHP